MQDLSISVQRKETRNTYNALAGVLVGGGAIVVEVGVVFLESKIGREIIISP